MKKFYENDNFWIGVGADHTFNCLKLMGGDCSLAEVYTYIESKVLGFDEEEIVKIKNQNTIMLVDAWIEVRRIILAKVKEMEENGWDYPHCHVSDYKDLYLILNKDASVYDLFSDKSEDNDVYKAMREMLMKLEGLKTPDEIITEISAFIHENYVKGTFGSNTQLFCWFFMQMVLIFNNFGPAVSFPNRYFEMLEMFPISNLLYGEIMRTKKSEWMECEYFKTLTNFWIVKSKEYHKFIEENYM
ncbi:hypothetical protein [Spiroplasma endosymbiont of Diplazon laetatorius]|uniref:hypothetical protein n=1 Tax=Spiroplasma endosymbiont of Diplazon laetatorius TaxID=3066322 RepID=UPI0030CA92C9